jgi:methionine synthase reductase
MVEPTTEKIEVEMLVLYASQTGNCEAISEDLLDPLAANVSGSKFKRFVLNDIDKKWSLEKKEVKKLQIAIFILSSTGDGEMPENGEKFYRWLRRTSGAQKEGESPLNHLYFTMLGLGSTDYSKYQGNSRFVQSRLKTLGAKFFYNKGEADEATGLEDVVEPWLEGLYPAIKKQI